MVEQNTDAPREKLDSRGNAVTDPVNEKDSQIELLLDTLEQLRELNQNVNKLLDSCMRWLRGADSEVLDGLREIKDFIDPKGQMSWNYFKRNLLPGLREAVLIDKGFRGCREARYMCFKVQVMAYFLKRRKI